MFCDKIENLNSATKSISLYFLTSPTIFKRCRHTRDFLSHCASGTDKIMLTIRSTWLYNRTLRTSLFDISSRSNGDGYLTLTGLLIRENNNLLQVWVFFENIENIAIQDRSWEAARSFTEDVSRDQVRTCRRRSRSCCLKNQSTDQSLVRDR